MTKIKSTEATEPTTAPDVLAAMAVNDEAEAKVVNGMVEVPRDNGTTTFTNSVTEKVTEPKVGDETVFVPAPVVPLISETIPGVTVDQVETPVVVRETRVIDERLTRAGADAYLAKIQVTNPRKFAAKKVELETRLADAEAKAKAAEVAAKADKKVKKDEEVG